MLGDVPLEMSKPNPRMLIISEQNILRLFIDTVSYNLQYIGEQLVETDTDY
jgi:hypothetical protein